MLTLVTTINKVSEWSGKAVMFLIIPMFIIPFTESVIFRTILDRATLWGLEATVFIYGAYFILAGAFCHRYRMHVSMDLLYRSLPIRPKAVLDVLICIIIFIFCGVILWYGGQWALESTMRFEKTFSPWSPYIWPIRWTVPIAAALFILQGFGDLIVAIKTLISGKDIALALSENEGSIKE